MGNSRTDLLEQTGRWRRPSWRGPWPAVALGLLCFLNTLPHDFTYDDLLLVKATRLDRLPELLWTDWWKLATHPDDLSPKRDRLYRPLTLLTFAGQHALHGHHPLGYHAVNVLLHGGACLLVWLLARRLTRDDAVAGLTAVVFAVHPVHVEAVANIVGRAEILSALGMLAGLLVLTRPGAPPGPGRALRAALFFLLALFSKENAVCYPAVALLALLTSPPAERPPPRRWLTLTAVLVLPLLVYFPLRFVALEGHLFRARPAELVMNPTATAEGAERIVMALTILGHYTRLLIVPARLSCDYGLAILDPNHGVTGMTVLGAVAALGLVAGLTGFRRRPTGPVPLPARLVAILCAMFLASYALISNTVLLIGVSLAERLMYWPSVPALLLLTVIVSAAWRRGATPGRPLAHRAGLLRGLGALLLLALAVRTVVRNGDWADNVRLFGADIVTYPQGAHLHKAYAFELLTLWNNAPPEDKPALLHLAREHLDQALVIHPGGAEALAVRASVRAQQGDREGAMVDIEAALQLDPQLRVGHDVHAKLLFGEEAETHVASLREQVASRPADPAPLRELGDLLLRLGRYRAAREHLETAVALAPADVDALRSLGKVLVMTDAKPQAIDTFQHVLRLAPNDWESHANLVTLLSERDPRAALHHAQRAFDLFPAEPRNAINLAEAYALNGQKALAIALLQAVMQGLDAESPLRPVVAQRLDYLRRS